MIELISISIVIGVIGGWFGCGYLGTRLLYRKGYGRALHDRQLDQRYVDGWDPISRGSPFGPSAYGALLPFIAGPITLLVAALLSPQRPRR